MCFQELYANLIVSYKKFCLREFSDAVFFCQKKKKVSDLSNIYFLYKTMPTCYLLQ